MGGLTNYQGKRKRNSEKHCLKQSLKLNHKTSADYEVYRIVAAEYKKENINTRFLFVRSWTATHVLYSVSTGFYLWPLSRSFSFSIRVSDNSLARCPYIAALLIAIRTDPRSHINQEFRESDPSCN